jgi:hypothetical protein
MKRAAMILGMLSAATFLAAQQQTSPAQPQQPAGGTSQQGSAAPAPAVGKRPPQAKTQPEFDGYNAAMANQKDAAAMEKAADDFATKFPDSELRVLLYKAAMRAYQNANNGDKMLETAQKLLKLDPDDPEALIASAEVITERTRDTDLDKDQRFAEATKERSNITRKNMPTRKAISASRSMLIPPNQTPSSCCVWRWRWTSSQNIQMH